MSRLPHDMRLLSAVCVAWAGVAAALGLRLEAQGCGCYAVVAGVVSVGAVLMMRRVREASLALRWLALTAAVTTGLLAATGWCLDRQHAGPVRELAVERATVSIDAVVSGQPHRIADSSSPQTSFVVPVTITSIDGRGRTSQVETPAIIVGDERWGQASWKSHLRVTGRLAPSTRIGEAAAVLAVRGPPTQSSGPPVVVTALEPVRGGLRDAAGTLPQDPAGLVPALVVGDTSRLPESLVTAMNATGMSHLNAVSGSNVTIVLIATMWVLRWSPLGARSRLFVALIALAAYVILCRPEPSVIRAAAMGGAGVVGTSWGRASHACPTLGVSIVGLLAWDPWLAISPGFALSALATLGLVLFARDWAERIGSRWSSWLPRWGMKVIEVVCIPIAAQALCLPILIALSGSVSWVSIPANVLAEPFVAPATLAGMAVALLAAAWPQAAELVVWLPGLPAWAISGIARAAAQVPAGSLPWLGGWIGALAGAMVVLLLLCATRFLRWLGRFGVLAASSVVAIVLAGTIHLPGDDAAPAAWVYVQCDVGQGDAALIRTGPHRAVAVDLGPPDGHVSRCLERHGVTALDAVVLTHFHADHVGGLREAFDVVGPAPVFVTWVTEDAGGDEASSEPRSSRGEKGAKKSVHATLREAHLEAQALAPGRVITIGTLRLEVLWPARVIHEGSVQNNASLVLDVSEPQLHALMLGDCEREAQQSVVAAVQQRAQTRAYDVVKVAHHGSSNQAAALYRAAHPRMALIGVGRNNDYGHPKAVTLQMLTGLGVATWRTDLEGDLDVLDSGGSLSVQPES